MREDLLNKLLGLPANQRLNVLRETLQWQVMAALHSVEVFRSVAFVGGTSLRLLHGLARYSEDLDFSVLDQPVSADDVNSTWKEAIRKSLLRLEITNTEFTVASHRAVLAFDIRWAELLHQVGAASLPGQKISIKVEIDNHPPAGAVVERKTVSRPSLMAIATYELPSLMAGKVHALLARPYTKGRDWYDLLWYLGGGIEPNEKMLGHALTQIPSTWCPHAKQWRESLLAKAESTDWALVKKDVQRFLENQGELGLLERDTVIATLRQPKHGIRSEQ